MKYQRYYIYLISVQSLLNLVSASGHLEIKFISYENKHGFDAAKRHCDPNISGGKLTKCDLIFRAKFNGQNGGVGPTWPTINSITYHNHDSVFFGSYIGSSLLNPFQLKFTRWHGILNLNLEVIDRDSFTTDDHVDTFSTSILVTPDNVDRHHRITGQIHSHNSVFQFSLRVACDANFLSPTCLERCTENQGENVCGVASSRNICTSESCRQESKVIVIVIPLVVIVLLLVIAVLIFRKRRRIRLFLISKTDNVRIPEGKVKFENNLYVSTEQQDVGEKTENEGEFANRLYGLGENSSQRHSDDQNDGSLYDSLESNNVSDLSEIEDDPECGREMQECKNISTI